MNTQVHRAAQTRGPKTKRKLPIKLILVAMTLLVLGFIAVIGVVIVYAMRSNSGEKDIPLVLIHSPLNREQVSEGDGVLVHATARSQAGLRRVELWVDDMLIAQRDAGGDEPPTSMVLSADWVPTIAGNHHLIVRAISARDADGQATVDIETIESDDPETTNTHTVQEGETLPAIAEDYGVTADDLVALNPGIDPAGNPAPGTEIIVPGGEPYSEPPSEGSQPIPTDSEPPPTVAELPIAFNLLYFVGFSAADEEPGEPIPLRMELIALRTPLAYENLNCYVGIAGQTPLRYPDADGDQSTDESFAILAGSPTGGTSWNIGDYLHGEHVPSFSWPENQDLPFDMSCVGISGGGTQANRLGRIELAVSPEDWDGFVHQADVVGPEGAYGVSYRVSRVNDEPGGAAKELDPNMTPPTSLGVFNYDAVFGDHSEDGASSFFVSPYDRVALTWEYNPRPGEVVATVFRVYLNGARIGHGVIDTSSGTPSYFFGPVGPEIQHPACGEQYVWTVTAWRPGGDNDGFESPPSDPLIFETPDDRNCGQTVSINFLYLDTLDLGGDGETDDRWGDVGPVFGDFYANDQIVHFSGGPLELPPGTGRIGLPWGLDHYSSYDLDGSDAEEPFQTAEPLRFIAVHIPWFEALDFGLVIMDDDDGRCRDTDDPGCDDPVCSVAIHMVPARDIHNYDRYEANAWSENGRCRLTYNYQLGADSPLDRPEW